MAITVTTDETQQVTVAMKGEEFTAEIRTLRQREAARAAIIFARVQRGFAKMIASFPKPVVIEGEDAVETVQVNLTDLAPAEQDAVLEASADLMDDLILAGAYGLSAVHGLSGSDGKPLQVPLTFESRQEFIDRYLGFPQMMRIALATIEFNSLTEKDAGN
jgi:hypothetical protein